VVAAFFASGVTLGTAYSFGAFFESMSEEFDAAKSATAVIFGVTTFLFFSLSIITGRMSDRFGPRVVLLIGAVVLFAGLITTSRVQSLRLGYVTYGTGVGIAAACGYVPMVWFAAGSSYAMLVLFVIVLGVGYGGFVALSPIVISDRLGVAGLGSILGLLYTAPGIGALIGTPTAGWLIDSTDGYRWAITACLACAVAAVVLLSGLPVDGHGRLERADNARG
jgi:MFS family permease